MTRVSVVVPTWRTRELTLRCLAGVAAQLGADDELVVVDDAGGDGTAQAVRAIHPRATLVEHASNRGYTAAVRSGVERAAGRLLLLLNSDARLLPGALESLVAFLEDRPAHAAVAPRLVDGQGRTRHELMNLPRRATPLWHARLVRAVCGESSEWRRWHARDVDVEAPGNVEQPPAACLLLRRSDWELCGGLDARLALFFSDVELCARLAERGRLVGYLPEAAVEHDGGASTSLRHDFALAWHRDRYAFHRARHGLAGGLCAFAASGLDLCAHLWRPASPEPRMPLVKAWLAMPFGGGTRAA